MTAADRARWDARYAGADQSVAPRAPDIVSEHLALLPMQGRALDVACGRGATAVWLAQQGLEVDAIDISPVAVAAAQQLAAANQVAHRLRAWTHDLDDGLPRDLMTGRASGEFVLVVCQRFRDPNLYAALRAALAPRGLLAISVLSSVSGSAGPFRAQPGELLGAFANLQVIAHREADGEAHLLAQRVG